MQRLFTMFPAGAPGTALTLLRVGVAAGLWLPVVQASAAPSTTGLFVTGIASGFLLFGLATPVVGAIAFTVTLMRLADPIRLGVWMPADVLLAAVQGSTALALTLIGPGALSLDAWLFGRRVLVSW